MEERKRKIYCHIVSCINNSGTVKRDQYMFRVPKSNDDQKKKWINAIEKFQKIEHRIDFNVCSLHFNSDDYETKGKKVALKSDVVPSIFQKADDLVDVIIRDEIVEEAMNNEQCAQCPFLLEKISELKKELLRLTLNQSISVQRLEQNNISLKKVAAEKSEELKQTKNQLSSQKMQFNNLKDILDKLKTESYISADEQKYLNVIFPCIHVVELFRFDIRNITWYKFSAAQTHVQMPLRFQTICK